MRILLAVAAFTLCPVVFAQIALPQLAAGAVAFSYEDKDWGIAPTTTAKRAPFHAPTPISIPGGRVIKTLELKALLEQLPSLVVVDVLAGRNRLTVPGAYSMAGAGDPQFFGAEKARLSEALGKLLEGDKSRPVVFLCSGSECWISYNAALHAIDAGFKDVLWFRGGTDAWKGAGLDVKPPRVVNW